MAELSPAHTAASAPGLGGRQRSLPHVELAGHLRRPAPQASGLHPPASSPTPRGKPGSPRARGACAVTAHFPYAHLTRSVRKQKLWPAGDSTLPHRLVCSGNARTARPRGTCYGRVLIGGRGGACVRCRAGSPREEPDASRGPSKAERVDESWAVAEPAKRIRRDRASGRGGIAA